MKNINAQNLPVNKVIVIEIEIVSSKIEISLFSCLDKYNMVI